MADEFNFVIQERGTGQLASRRLLPDGRCCYTLGGRCTLPIFHGRICPMCCPHSRIMCWGGDF